MTRMTILSILMDDLLWCSPAELYFTIFNFVPSQIWHDFDSLQLVCSRWWIETCLEAVRPSPRGHRQQKHPCSHLSARFSWPTTGGSNGSSIVCFFAISHLVVYGPQVASSGFVRNEKYSWKWVARTSSQNHDKSVGLKCLSLRESKEQEGALVFIDRTCSTSARRTTYK